MLGELSKYPEGVEYVLKFSINTSEDERHYCHRLLERFNIFTAFYHLGELRSRDDLVKGIIQAIDYSL